MKVKQKGKKGVNRKSISHSMCWNKITKCPNIACQKNLCMALLKSPTIS